MQEKSPFRRHSVPWLANVVTVVALVGTTWWSGEQRPVIAAHDAASQAVLPADSPAMRIRDSRVLPVQSPDKASRGLIGAPQANKSSVVLASWRATEAPAQRGAALAPAVTDLRSVPPIVDH